MRLNTSLKSTNLNYEFYTIQPAFKSERKTKASSEYRVLKIYQPGQKLILEKTKKQNWIEHIFQLHEKKIKKAKYNDEQTN